MVSYVAPVALDLGKDTILCSPDTLTLDVSGIDGSSYLWQDNSTDSIYTIHQAGLYWVEVEKNGCKFRDSILVQDVFIAPVDLGNDTILCPDETLSLYAGNINGGNYIWQDNSRNSSYLVDRAGLYWVEVEVNGCTSKDSIRVSYSSPTTFGLGKDTMLCPFEFLTLDATHPNATNYTWQDNQRQTKYTVSQAGLYWVEVEIDGCLFRDSILVNYKSPIYLDLGNDTVLCSADILTLNPNIPSAQFYVWQDNSTGKTFSVDQGGLYWVEVEVDGCKYRDSISITYSNMHVDLGKDTIICAESSLNLNVFRLNAAYLWQDGSRQATYSLNTAGLYWVEVELNGCKVRDSIKVSVHPPIGVDLGNDTVLCDTQSILLDAFHPGATYQWQDGSTASRFSANQSGFYEVTVTSGNCQESDRIKLSFEEPISIAIEDTMLCKGSHLFIKSGQVDRSILWSDGSGDDEIGITSGGRYWIEVSNGCYSKRDTFWVKESLCECHLFVPNAFSPNNHGVNETFRPVSHCSFESYEFIIYDRWGKQLFFTTDALQGWSGSDVPIGNYVYYVRYKFLGEDYFREETGSISLIR